MCQQEEQVPLPGGLPRCGCRQAHHDRRPFPRRRIAVKVLLQCEFFQPLSLLCISQGLVLTCRIVPPRTRCPSRPRPLPSRNRPVRARRPQDPTPPRRRAPEGAPRNGAQGDGESAAARGAREAVFTAGAEGREKEKWVELVLGAELSVGGST